MTCPRCGASLAAEQDWCLECGAAARTRIARTPNWRLPVFLVVLLVALSGAAAAFAFVRLSNTDDDLKAAQSAATATQPAAASPAPTATTAPATTVPAAAAPDAQATTPKGSAFTTPTTTTP